MRTKPPKVAIMNLKQSQIPNRARPITSVLTPNASMPFISNELLKGPQTSWNASNNRNLLIGRRQPSIPKSLYKTYQTNSISVLTHERNEHDTEKIAKMRLYQDQERLRHNIHEDTKALLVKTEQQLRSMKYKLTTLVSNGEGH